MEGYHLRVNLGLEFISQRYMALRYMSVIVNVVIKGNILVVSRQLMNARNRLIN